MDALRLMHDRKIHRVFVMNAGRLVGMIDNNVLLAGLVSPRAGIAACGDRGIPDQVRIFRVIPTVISVLDYSKGFGHTDLVTP